MVPGLDHQADDDLCRPRHGAPRRRPDGPAPHRLGGRRRAAALEDGVPARDPDPPRQRPEDHHGQVGKRRRRDRSPKISAARSRASRRDDERRRLAPRHAGEPLRQSARPAGRAAADLGAGHGDPRRALLSRVPGARRTSSISAPSSTDAAIMRNTQRPDRPLSRRRRHEDRLHLRLGLQRRRERDARRAPADHGGARLPSAQRADDEGGGSVRPRLCASSLGTFSSRRSMASPRLRLQTPAEHALGDLRPARPDAGRGGRAGPASGAGLEFGERPEPCSAPSVLRLRGRQPSPAPGDARSARAAAAGRGSGSAPTRRARPNSPPRRPRSRRRRPLPSKGAKALAKKGDGAKTAVEGPEAPRRRDRGKARTGRPRSPEAGQRRQAAAEPASTASRSQAGRQAFGSARASKSEAKPLATRSGQGQKRRQEAATRRPS